MVIRVRCPSRCAGLAGPACAAASGPFGSNSATASSPTQETAPLPAHIAAQSAPYAASPATNAADNAIPTPTPAKCTAPRPGRPAFANVSSTKAVARIRTNALATPPANRTARNHPSPPSYPIAAVVTALIASAPNNHQRRGPGKDARAAPNAPARYPAKLADAISPAVALLNPKAAIIGGRIGV